jgi:hypothetical protein
MILLIKVVECCATVLVRDSAPIPLPPNSAAFDGQVEDNLAKVARAFPERWQFASSRFIGDLRPIKNACEW